MKETWNRIVEVRGGGGAAEGLEYRYPCGHARFVSAADVLANTQDPAKFTPNGGSAEAQFCPEGCEIQTEESVKEALNK